MNANENLLAEFEAPIQAFAYFIGPSRAIYVSAPITSGWRFLTWYRERGQAIKNPALYQQAHANEVIAPNCREVAGTIAGIKRRVYPKVVIDPTSFDIPHWNQNDYRYFWSEVIKRFVDEAVFLAGWEASTGSVFELRVALRNSVQLVHEDGTPLQTSDAIELIRSALKAMQQLELNTEIHEAALEELQVVQDSPGIPHRGRK
jgi:hypothetical protein